MSTATAELSLAELASALVVLADIARAWADASAQTGGDWPDGACVETSVMVRDEMRARCPSVEAEYVWGDLLISGRAFGHAWVALRDGTIADGTLGQFLIAPPAYRLIRPGDPLAALYVEQERPEYGV